MGDLSGPRRADLFRARGQRHRRHLCRQRHQAAFDDFDLPAPERDADLDHRRRSMKRFLVLSALVLLLAGCAAEEAYKDGVTLMGAGKPEESMAKFEEALTHDPRDVQYRSAWLRAREQVLTRSVEQADKLASKGAFDESRKLYRHALSLDPSYERALDGLAALDARMRQTGLMDDADSLLAKGKTEEASQKLARVLTEAPNDPRALGIKRAIDGRQAPPAAQKLAQSYQKPITIEFKDVSLKQVFEVLAHGSGLNFLFDKDVKTDQHTSIFLKNSTIEAAVRFVLLTNQLDSQVMDGNTVLIYPNNAGKQKDYQELDVRTFYLANAEAKTVANTLKTILKIRDIAVDEKLNMLVLRDTPDAIRMAEKLVAVEDVADPEVMLDVEVLEVQRNWLQDLGVQWPASATVTPTPLGTAVGTNTSTGTGTGTGTGVTGNSTSNSTSILSLHDLAHQTSRSLGVSLGGATANANVQDSHAKLLTNPRIRVRNHDKAKILIGERVPNITSTATSTGFLSQSVSYIDVGLTLNVEPTIYLDDNVGIKVSLEVSSIINTITTQTGTTAYEIGTRNTSTSLRLKNGETDVLAGLIDTTERTSGNKLPGLGDMPILGSLFGATTDDDEKTEIVLAITPHLVRNVQRPDAANAMFNSGTETSLHGVGGGGGSAAPVSSSSTSSSLTGSNSAAPSTPAAPAGAGAVTGNSTGYGTAAGDTGLTQNALTGSDASTGTGEVAAGGVPAAGIAQLQWQGNPVAAVGSNFTLSLVMQSTQAITSLPMTIGFDPAKLEVVNIAEGPFLRSGGSATTFTSRLGSGQLTLSDVSTSGAGATAEGVFATITFRPLAAATSTSVQLLSAAPTGIGNVGVSLAPPAPFSLQITQ